MNRRAWLISTLTLLASPSRGRAQAPGRTFRIGLLAGSSPTSPQSRHIWAAFFGALRDLGYVEGQNVAFEGRYYGDRPDRVAGMAEELVRLRVDVIVAAAPPAPEAARRATSTIPIVMANHSDPVASGLAASYARPGGNVTGLSLASHELRVKILELLKEILPRLRRVALLRQPTVPLDTRELERAADALKIQVQFVDARAPGDIADALARATRERADAMIVLAGNMFFSHRVLIAERALQSRLPTAYLFQEHVLAGGLVSYGIDLRDNFRRAARFVDRILKGARPAELPIERPTKFWLAVNLKTAKALGLAVPPSVLARADETIE
jgi:putative ABC transport system substrate-binding protein